jgi:DNA repair ATPase RecN
LHLVGLIINKFVTMHGHMNVKIKKGLGVLTGTNGTSFSVVDQLLTL